MLLRDEHDDRLRELPPETRRGVHGLCGYDLPIVPLISGVVPETTEADQHPHREG